MKTFIVKRPYSKEKPLYASTPSSRLMLPSIEQAHRDIDSFFSSVFGPVFPFASSKGRQENEFFVPSLDVHSTDKEYIVTLEVPGIEKENIQLEVRENVLIISGEKKETSSEEKFNYHHLESKYGAFERTLSMPEDAVVDQINAKQKDGLLNIIIPRKEPEKVSSKKITIADAN